MKNYTNAALLLAIVLTAVVAKGEETFTFASWNIGHYALGKDWKTAVRPEEAAAKGLAYRKLLDEVGADFLGVCEYFDSFTTNAEHWAATSVFGRYAHREIGPQHAWQWNAQFWNGEPASGSCWRPYAKHLQDVYYLATKVKIGGEDVTFVQTHLDWGTQFEGHEGDRASQMRELIAAFRNEHHVVIAGDFNVGVRFKDRTKKTLDNPAEYKVFEEAGFTLGNDGRFKTAPAGACFMSLDNIIVKGLEISDFKVWDCPDLSDHALVSAKLKLKGKGTTVVKAAPGEGVLERVQLEARAASARGETVVVELADGAYPLKKPLVFGPEDSGVTWRAAEGARPVVTGGRKITGWKAETDGVWSVDVPWIAEIWAKGGFRHLTAKGEPRTRSRQPNAGFLMVKGENLKPKQFYNSPHDHFVFREGDLKPEWANNPDIDLLVCHYWVNSHLKIKTIEPGTNLVTFVEPARKHFSQDFTIGKTIPAGYWLENAREFCDQPGEWALDVRARKVYYRPMAGERLETFAAVAPTVEQLLVMKGTPRQNGRWCERIRFEGIVFEETNYNLREKSVNDWLGALNVAASAETTGTRDVAFVRCVFRNLGGFGAELKTGSQRIVFDHCHFKSLGAGGIQMNGGNWGSHVFDETRENTITDCTIEDYGRDYRSGVGVRVSFSAANRIVHNEICGGNYTAMFIGWEFGYAPTVARDNVVAYNHLHDIGRGMLSDMGGIYTLGFSPGTVLDHNLIHDVEARTYGGWGIYSDEGSTGILVENNIVYDTKCAPYNINYARDMLVKNNIFAFGREDQISKSMREEFPALGFFRNIVYFEEGKLFNVTWNEDAEFGFHRYGGMNKTCPWKQTYWTDWNVFYNPKVDPKTFVVGDGKTFGQWQKAGRDVHSVWADPQFVDVAKRDFRLKPGSPALKLGFNPIATTQIGPRR